MAPLPPIFNPRILYGVDPFPYTPLKMFGDYNRQIEQPADVFPTLSIMTGLDPNNKGDVARFDANHNLKVVDANGAGGSGVTLTGKNYASCVATANTNNQDQGFSGGSNSKLYSVTWSVNLNSAFPTADAFGPVWFYIYPASNPSNGGFTIFNVGLMWKNSTTTLFGGPFGGQAIFPGGLDLSQWGFGSSILHFGSTNGFPVDVQIEYNLNWVG